MANFNCFDNFIGTSRAICNPVVPESSLYLEDLAGITLVDAAKLSDSEKLTGKKVMEDVISFAQKLVNEDYKNIIRPYVRQTQILENAIAGYYPIPTTASASEAKYKGVLIRVDDSRNVGIYINTVSLWTDSAQSIDILIFDARNGVQLDVIPITTIGGEITTISVNKFYLTEGQNTAIFVAWDEIDNTILTPVFGTGGAGCGSCLKNGQLHFPYVTVKAAEVSNASVPSYSNLRFTGYTGGLSVKFNLECSMENYLCSIRNILKLHYLYKAGSEFMLERIHSTRLNNYTFVTIDKAKELREFYEKKYIELMMQTAQTARPPDDVCFYCREGLKQTVSIP